MSEETDDKGFLPYDKKTRSNIYFALFLLAIFMTVLIHSCTYNNDTVVKPSDDEYHTPKINSIHVALGVPEDGTPSDDYWMQGRPQYIISYNDELHAANWVAWNLDASWYGDAPRFSGNFKEDPLLPDGFYRVKHSDFTNSGYDRGHMVRSEERTANDEDNLSTFYTTNIIAQHPDLNQGPWAILENYCEDLCKKQNKELFIVAGGIFHTKNRYKDIVPIADSCFKIIVVLDRDKGLKEVNKSTQIIAVMMPNQTGIRKVDWKNYLTSIDRIENSTGYDFLNALPVSIQKEIEARTATAIAYRSGVNRN